MLTHEIYTLCNLSDFPDQFWTIDFEVEHQIDTTEFTNCTVT